MKPALYLETSVVGYVASRISADLVTAARQATVDAAHIAVAAVGGMDYLLTWNFKHIANAVLRDRIERVCRSSGYKPAVICTPEELLDGEV